MSAGPIVVLAIGIAVVVLVAVISYRMDKKRREALQAFALSNGWTYSASDDSWCDRFAGEPFGEGDSRTSRNILRGPYEGTEMVAFDYCYETHSSDSKGNRNTTKHRFAICALGLKAPLPGLELSPESLMTRLGNAIGFDDVELESEDFNRRYRVHARDAKFAYDVLNPRTMQALLTRPAVHMRLLDADAVSWSSGRLDPVELLAHLSTLQLVVAGIPSFVWSDHSSGGAPA
jgi:hypothetical protein